MKVTIEIEPFLYASACKCTHTSYEEWDAMVAIKNGTIVEINDKEKQYLKEEENING